MLTPHDKQRIKAKVKVVIDCHCERREPTIEEIEIVERWRDNEYKEPRVVEINMDGYGYIGNGENCAILPDTRDAIDIFNGRHGATQQMTERQFTAWRHRKYQHLCSQDD